MGGQIVVLFQSPYLPNGCTGLGKVSLEPLKYQTRSILRNQQMYIYNQIPYRKKLIAI